MHACYMQIMRILQSQHKPTRKVTTVNATDVVTVVYCLGHDQTVRHKTCTQTSDTSESQTEAPEPRNWAPIHIKHCTCTRVHLQHSTLQPFILFRAKYFFLSYNILYYFSIQLDLYIIYVYNDLYSASAKSIYFYAPKRKKSTHRFLQSLHSVQIKDLKKELMH